MYVIQDMAPGGDQWRISKHGQTIMTSGFKDVLRYTVGKLGFDISDFERALHAIVELNHNTLEFDNSLRLRSTSFQPIQRNRKAG